MKEVGKIMPLAFIPFVNVLIQYVSMVSNRRMLKKGWVGRFALSLLITFALAFVLLNIQPYVADLVNKSFFDFIGFYLFSTCFCVQMVFLQRKFL